MKIIIFFGSASASKSNFGIAKVIQNWEGLRQQSYDVIASSSSTFPSAREEAGITWTAAMPPSTQVLNREMEKACRSLT